jgi:hypothetical protein|tara:strand:- start:516 stop:734 length:219 start_codon:yes stop_codon:yes gene_type:complete
MKMQYRIINRVSRKEQILNANEVAKFFKLNSIREYAISTIKPTEDKIFKTLFVSFVSVVFVVCITKIIVQWL